MFEAKALVGKKAGEIIYAKDSSLTHELCKLWKIYCPECKQFLYFSKSKNPDKLRSYFGHYDYEDKRCPERSLAANQSNQSASFAESHKQDLETAELFVEQVFYGIDPEYFRNLNQQDGEEENQKVTDAIKWLKASLLHDCKNWVRHYCQTTGFLDWKNPEKEISYLMDWLYVLARREDILRDLALYFSLKIPSQKKDISSAQEKLGFSQEKTDSSSSIWLVALDQILERLADLVKNGFAKSKLDLLPEKAIMGSSYQELASGLLIDSVGYTIIETGVSVTWDDLHDPNKAECIKPLTDSQQLALNLYRSKYQLSTDLYFQVLCSDGEIRDIKGDAASKVIQSYNQHRYDNTGEDKKGFSFLNDFIQSYLTGKPMTLPHHLIPSKQVKITILKVYQWSVPLGLTKPIRFYAEIDDKGNTVYRESKRGTRGRKNRGRKKRGK